MAPTSASSYTKVAIILHWLIALLMIGQLAGGIYMHEFAKGLSKFTLYQWHKSFGITILALSILRLFWRLTHRPPPLPEDMKFHQVVAAKLTHIGFYVVMIGMPIIGWMMVSASPYEIPTILFKVLPLPDFPAMPRDIGVESFLKQTHKYMGYAAIGLIILHIGAALKHHFINRDTVLSRMLPFIKSKS